MMYLVEKLHPCPQLPAACLDYPIAVGMMNLGAWPCGRLGGTGGPIRRRPSPWEAQMIIGSQCAPAGAPRPAPGPGHGPAGYRSTVRSGGRPGTVRRRAPPAAPEKLPPSPGPAPAGHPSAASAGHSGLRESDSDHRIMRRNPMIGSDGP
eukprot:499195-Hanusia_phi.AAC.2